MGQKKKYTNPKYNIYISLPLSWSATYRKLGGGRGKKSNAEKQKEFPNVAKLDLTPVQQELMKKAIVSKFVNIIGCDPGTYPQLKEKKRKKQEA